LICNYVTDKSCMGAKLGLQHYVRNIDRVFQNRVLRKILGPKRDEVTRDWRKLHNNDR
jgi:hypothetical protein